MTKESESLLKRKELEKRYEALEAESSTVRGDLRLALKRIEDLQAVIQNDLEDSTENSDRLVYFYFILFLFYFFGMGYLVVELVFVFTANMIVIARTILSTPSWRTTKLAANPTRCSLKTKEG